MFKKFIDCIVIKRRYLVVDECDVMNVLRCVNFINGESKILIMNKMEIGNCGWVDEPDKWFIHYNASNKQWHKLIEYMGLKNYRILLNQEERLYLMRG